MTEEVRHDDDLANKADWLEELIIGVILDLKKADGSTVYTSSALVLNSRPGSKKHELFSKIKKTTGI